MIYCLILRCIDLSNDEYLHFLLEARDLTRFSELAMRLMKAGKEGLFDTWMLKESDLVQVRLTLICIFSIFFSNCLAKS